ncbi:MAG: 1,4-dihydroxy-6-naphthoate synthase [Bacteroidota bacterium]|nr:1,4-dihydroxy-6-naphthoate synthase [Bacteroidota bacterium]
MPSVQKISLAISPCPNDCFIFGAWINGLLKDTIKLSKVSYLDIQELNNSATQSLFDVIKVSAAKLDTLLDDYQILTCGGAMGVDNGPLLITKDPLWAAHPEKFTSELGNLIIALPGMDTTAHFLFNFAYPQAGKKVFVPFSEIEAVLLNGECDAGVIIHENRFTYREKGLHLITDLGNYWIKIKKLPIPLGLIAIKRSLPEIVKINIKNNIKNSLKYAQTNPPGGGQHLQSFIRSHSQEMSAEVCQEHITLYVNEYSMDLGESGQKAILSLLEAKGLLKKLPKDLFI